MTTLSPTEQPSPPFPGPRRSYRCQCGRPVFFPNSECLACNSPLGYEPLQGRILALEAGDEPGSWRPAGEAKSPERVYQRCGNITSASGCNWLITVDPAKGGNGLCVSCQLNRMIPNLDNPWNGESWRKIEDAKRRLVSSLLGLGLPVVSKAEDAAHGLAFDFLSDEGGKVVTGHEDGIITLNIAEADDATRESIRQRLHEPYRTILGHLRHEVGHYYWDRLIDGSEWIGRFRDLFGDERANYSDALQAHYNQGPPPDWQERYITSYASSHPWEDWAETWAHYLHIGDTLNTAESFGLDIDSVEMPIDPFESVILSKPDEKFTRFVNSWVRLTAVLNELSRSMGLRDFNPFVLSNNSIRKLHFVHQVTGGYAKAK